MANGLLTARAKYQAWLPGAPLGMRIGMQLFSMSSNSYRQEYLTPSPVEGYQCRSSLP